MASKSAKQCVTDDGAAPAPLNLSYLGPDLLLRVAACLPTRDRLRLALTVCRSLRALLLSKPALRAGLWRNWELAVPPHLGGPAPGPSPLAAVKAIPWGTACPRVPQPCELDLAGQRALTPAALCEVMMPLMPVGGPNYLVAVDLTGCSGVTDPLLDLLGARCG